MDFIRIKWISMDWIGNVDFFIVIFLLSAFVNEYWVGIFLFMWKLFVVKKNWIGKYGLMGNS